MSDYDELIERLDGYKSKWMGSALISDAAAAIRELREERDALRMPAELVERATDMTEFTSLSTKDWREHMEVLLLDILAWHESLKEGKDERS